MKKLLLILILLGLVIANSAGERINNALCNFYELLKNLLPVIVVVVIIFAAVVFAAGQVLGAETRSRANAWATNMIIYTIIAVIVLILVPYLIGQLSPEMNIENVCS